MNIVRPRIGFSFRRLPVRTLLLLLAAGATGCRGDGERSGGLFPRSRDPLMGADRIPPAGVPIPGKDGAYGAAPRDPLFKSPTASRAGAKEPFRLTEDFTPAAMSARGSDHTEPLIIDDRRPTAVPTGNSGVRPASGTGPAGGWEQLADELRRIGGKPFAPVKLPSGEYEFRCSVPIDTSGAMRQYTGVGPTPLAAVTDLYEQVRAERK
jgi:hypothetical protein